MSIVHFIEGRGQGHIGHFILFQLGSLYYILNDLKCPRGPDNTSICFHDKTKIIGYDLVYDSKYIKSYPIIITIANLHIYIIEAFDLISNKITLVTDLKNDDYKIMSIYGETCMNRNTVTDNFDNIIPFLRQLYSGCMSFDKCYKRIFITRNGSEKYHDGLKRRLVLNESELFNMLEKYGFIYINLEHLSFGQKIKLFSECNIIMGPHSGGLTFSIWANKGAKIIEIVNNGTRGGVCKHHYKEICRVLGIHHDTYTNILEDDDGNFTIDVDKFETYVKLLCNDVNNNK